MAAMSRMDILQMIEDGQLSAAEGLARLEALNAPPPEILSANEPTPRTRPANPELGRWRRWWAWPFGVGVLFSTLSAYWVYSAYAAHSTFGLVFAVLVFLLWTGFTVVAWSTRTMRWLHLRIQTGEKAMPRIALSFPLPISLTAWFIRWFGPYIPAFKNTALDEIIMALGDSATPETPLYVEVNESAKGERVEIYIG